MGPIWYVVPPGGHGASGPLTAAQLHARVAAGQVPDAARLYCKDTTGYRQPHRNVEVLRTGGGSTVIWRYNVNLVPDDHVIAIERNLEHALGIVDQPVAGEVQRTEGRS